MKCGNDDPVFFLVVDRESGKDPLDLSGSVDPFGPRSRVVMGILAAMNCHSQGCEVYKLGVLERVTSFDVEFFSGHVAS